MYFRNQCSHDNGDGVNVATAMTVQTTMTTITSNTFDLN